MNTKQEPEIGHWYQSIDGPLLKIIAVDNDDETIEIQYVDDAIEELDFDSWYGMEPELIDVLDSLPHTQYESGNVSINNSLLELVDRFD